MTKATERPQSRIYHCELMPGEDYGILKLQTQWAWCKQRRAAELAARDKDNRKTPWHPATDSLEPAAEALEELQRIVPPPPDALAGAGNRPSVWLAHEFEKAQAMLCSRWLDFHKGEGMGKRMRGKLAAVRKAVRTWEDKAAYDPGSPPIEKFGYSRERLGQWDEEVCGRAFKTAEYLWQLATMIRAKQEDAADMGSTSRRNGRALKLFPEDRRAEYRGRSYDALSVPVMEFLTKALEHRGQPFVWQKLPGKRPPLKEVLRALPPALRKLVCGKKGPGGGSYLKAEAYSC